MSSGGVHRVWTSSRIPFQLREGVQTLCIVLLLSLFSPKDAKADCPAAPIGDPNDMAISFLVANGVQAASASLLASSVKEGTLVYDDAANKLKVCDGTNWVAVGSGAGTDTLASLSCSSGQIAKYNGSAWTCAADGGSAGGGSNVVFSANKNGVDQTGIGWTSSTKLGLPPEKWSSLK